MDFSLLTLTSDERQFFSLFSDNEYHPELLFENGMLERVSNHPMATWKTQTHGRG